MNYFGQPGDEMNAAFWGTEVVIEQPADTPEPDLTRFASAVRWVGTEISEGEDRR